MSTVAQKSTEALPATPARPIVRFEQRVNQGLLHVVLVASAVLFLLPVFWLVISSFKTNVEFGAYPIQILPKIPIVRNYYDALTTIPYFVYMARSFGLAGAYSTLTVMSSALAGFGFARHRAPGRNALFLLIVAMIMVPGIITIIPQFILYSRLGIVGSYWPWILWGLSGSPFHIFLFRQFFAGFPKELEDAAEIDGCNRLRVFWSIFLPNAGPVIAASAIFSFQWVWGDYFLQTIFLNERLATLAMRLATAYVDPRDKPLYTQTMAAVVIYVLPLIIVFFFAQRSIIRGVVTSGIK